MIIRNCKRELNDGLFMIIRNCKRELKKDYDCIKVKLELNKTGCLLAVALNQFSNVL